MQRGSSATLSEGSWAIATKPTDQALEDGRVCSRRERERAAAALARQPLSSRIIRLRDARARDGVPMVDGGVSLRSPESRTSLLREGQDARSGQQGGPSSPCCCARRRRRRRHTAAAAAAGGQAGHFFAFDRCTRPFWPAICAGCPCLRARTGRAAGRSDRSLLPLPPMGGSLADQPTPILLLGRGRSARLLDLAGRQLARLCFKRRREPARANLSLAF
jgi:hypothetical protein